MQRIGLLFDCLKAPYDLAHIYQVSIAIGNCDLYLSGNSINPNHRKVVSKVKSWRIENIPIFRKFDDLKTATEQLHEEGKYLIGTSPRADKDIYSYNFTKNDSVLVFGTESSGLTKRKIQILDDIVTIPMSSECKFLTLPTVVPVVAYEFYRQIRRGQK